MEVRRNEAAGVGPTAGDPLTDIHVLTQKDNVKLVVKDGVPLVDRMGLESAVA
jgi:hypothetical protein